MSLTENTIGETIGEICDCRGKVCVEWKIPEYFSLSQRTDTYYESPSFLLSRSAWCIRIYLNGRRSNDTVGWFGLYLRKMDFIDTNSVVTFTLGIKNSDGTVYDSETLSSNFGSESIDGWAQFMERRAFFLLKERVVSRGILTLFCVASIPSGIEMASQTSVDSPCHLIKDFRTLLLSGEKSDVIFKVNGGELRAHKLILQTRSPVLNAMFQRDWKESNGVVRLTDCDSSTFHEFLLFIYTGKTENLTSENVTGLYSLADKYQVKELQEQCSDFMKNNLTLDTVCDIIALGDRHQEGELKEFAKELLVRNLKKILPTEKWKSFMVENPVLAVELLMTVIPEDGS